MKIFTPLHEASSNLSKKILDILRYGLIMCISSLAPFRMFSNSDEIEVVVKNLFISLLLVSFPPA